MSRRTPRLRALAAVLFLAIAGALPPAPAAAVDPPVKDAPQGEIFKPHPSGPTVVPAAPGVAPKPLAGAVVPSGFRDELVIGGLFEPTAVQFAADGRIIVGEKSGRISIYSSATDTSPGVYTALENNVYDLWDRGFLGMVIDPAFTSTRPYIYVSYTYNHILGHSASEVPRWNDGDCPTPPGITDDGCVASGRIDRLTVGGSGKSITGTTVILEGWCQQFPSHSMGSLAFGPEGALYATGGEGASFTGNDYGNWGGDRLDEDGHAVTPANPCGDPNTPVGTKTTLPGAEGGSLRAQDLRTTGPGDPVGLNGTLIRIKPETGGEAWPGNANIGASDENEQRILAYGLRNPFRFAIRPGTNEVWIGDVGNYSWEEINELPSANGARKNFGWPCYEGSGKNSDWNDLNVDICEDLYAENPSIPPTTVTLPAFKYDHSHAIVGEACDMSRGSAIAGITFLGTTSSYPDQYDKALFFTDYNRRCIWWVPATGAGGQPNFANVQLFANLTRPAPSTETGGAVFLGTDRNGDLVYADFDRGEIRAIRWYSDVPPTASFTANPTSGPTPLQVNFDASASTGVNPPLKYSWDLDGDGIYGDSTDWKPTWTYNDKESVVVGLRVSDSFPRSDTTTKTIWPGYVAPNVTMATPSSSLKWAVNDVVSFSGTATDGNGAQLPASAFAWAVNMEHCPASCHSHPAFYTLAGQKSGSFSAPDHGYPSHIRLRLTVTDGPVSTTVTRDIYPKTGVIRARSDPAGLSISLGGKNGTPPPNATAIVGSRVTLSAPATGALGVTQYAFDHWSDGNGAVHDVVATTATQTFTAHYRATGPVTEFRALDPTRILDTRVGNGLTGTFKANIARTFQVTGRGGIPADAVAVTGNLTVTHPTGAGYVALTPIATNQPGGSNLNFPIGVDRASVVTATLGSGGKLSAVYVAGSGKTAHLIFDVTGYFTAASSGGTYRPLDPVRLLDTRVANGLSGRFVVGTRRSWQITGRGGIPANATAVTANLTVTQPTAAGHVTLYPAGAPTSTTSTLNFQAGETAANGVVIRLGGGRLSAAMSGPTGASTHLVLDVTGYFVNDDGGARYVPLYPGRVLDTRIGTGLTGRFAANDGRNLAVSGLVGVPAGAVALNGTLTVTAPSAAGQLSLMRTAADTSATSTLNFVAGETRANGFFGRMSTGGSIGILFVGPSGATTHVVLDLAGYFK